MSLWEHHPKTNHCVKLIQDILILPENIFIEGSNSFSCIGGLVVKLAVAIG